MCRFKIKTVRVYCFDNTPCFACISNTYNSSFTHSYLACNQCMKTLSYILSNLFKKLYQWVPILLEKEEWKDIESYLLFCL